MKGAYLLTLLLGAIIGGWIVGRFHHRQPYPTTVTDVEVRYDTIYQTTIEPIEVQPLADTVYITDSVEVDRPSPAASPISLYKFRDTISDLWRAEVVGRDVELRSLTLHTAASHTTTTRYAPPRWEIVLRNDMGRFQQWTGVVATHNIGRLRLSAYAGYDLRHSAMGYGTSIGVSLWSR